MKKKNISKGNLANSAVYILSPEFISVIKKNFHFAKDFSTEIINKFLGKIYSYETKFTFVDIGTLESYRKFKNFKI